MDDYDPIREDPVFENLLRLLREFDADEALIANLEAFVASQAEDAPDDATVSDEVLLSIEDGLIALADDDEASAALLGEAADAVGAIRTEAAARIEVAEAEEAERQAAIRALRGEDPEAAAEGEPAEGEPAEGAADGGEGEGGEGGEGDGGEGTEGEPAEGAESESEREPVTASGNRASRRSISRARRSTRRPIDDEIDEHAEAARIMLATELPGMGRAAGSMLPDLFAVDDALEAKLGTFRANRSAAGVREQLTVASIAGEYPEARRLTGNPAEDAERIRSIIAEARGQSYEAITAAGGFCGILTPYRGVEVLGNRRRPIRDTALVGFQMTDNGGGGIVSMPPPTLPDFALDGTGAVGHWTAVNDADPGDDPGVPVADRFAVKPCLRVECGEPDDTMLEAVTLCLEFGTFMQRSNRPWLDANSALALVAHARYAERRLWAALVAKSKTVDAETTIVSATRDVLDAVDRLVTNVSLVHRDDAIMFRAVIPMILRRVIVTDLARGLPVGDPTANLRIAENILDQFFAARRVSVTWTPDVAIPAPIADGDPLTAWPDTIDVVIYPEGTHLFLDGGNLDLGVIRDSTLIGTNDAQMFSETFEATHQIGPESYHLNIALCPSGAVNGALDASEFCVVAP